MATVRTAFRHPEGFRAIAAFGVYNADYLWNNFTCLFYDNLIAYTDILSVDFVFVMQGGSFYGSTCQFYCFKLGHGCYFAEPAHLKLNIFDRCCCLFGFEFKSNGPARCFGGAAQF